MKALRNYFLATLIFVLCPFAFAWQGNTPESALEEMVTAEKLDSVTRHLPVQIQLAIEKLDTKDKKEVSAKLLVRSRMQQDGVTYSKRDDGVTWELKNEKNEPEGRVRLKNSFISGSDALLMLEFTDLHHGEGKDSQSNSDAASEDDKNKQLVFVGMRLEEGEWRLIRFGAWEAKSLEADDLLPHIAPHTSEANAAVAVSNLRTLNTALITYATTYPEVGLPANLQQLSGKTESEASSEHAMLLDPSFMAAPLLRDGYEFRYTLIDPGPIDPATGKRHDGSYRISATPIEFGKTGMKSFFTDESAVIRSTIENREATENDDPLQ
jgi:hypothetical protein